jgi:peptidoglycan/xylan/chitin deacetylase (PgdA/CDA1 family)
MNRWPVITASLQPELPAGSFHNQRYPDHTAYAFPKSVQAIAAAGHEIGRHDWIHEIPAMVSPERERWILEKGFKALKEVPNSVSHIASQSVRMVRRPVRGILPVVSMSAF